MDTINRNALKSFVFFFVALLLLLLLPAWTYKYWQAWIYFAIFFLSVGGITIYLSKHDLALLERRTKAGFKEEKEISQKIIQFIAQFAFIAVFLISSFDHKYRWSKVSVPWVLLADLLVLLGLYFVFLVFKENSFTSATVEINKNQKVISTGPYALVRHPMYSGALLMLLATPVALGSWWGLLTFIPMLLVIVWRLIKEEKFLHSNLPGYTEYTKKVRWRLLPGVF